MHCLDAAIHKQCCRPPRLSECRRQAVVTQGVVARASTRVLPNGLSLQYVGTGDELVLLYNENLGPTCTYLQHGVALKEGDTVIDVGANIGLFCMRAAQEVGPSGRVIGLEPVPEAGAAALANFAAHSAWCRGNGRPVCEPELIAAAAGAVSGTGVTMQSYSRALGWSSLSPDVDEVRSNMRAYLTNLLTASDNPDSSSSDGSGSSSSSSTAGGGAASMALQGPTQAPLAFSSLIQAGRLLRRLPVLSWAVSAAQVVAVEWMLASGRRVTVPQTTVSEVIRGRQLQQVDLLKVDVERGEWDVLLGIEDMHWPLIRQISMEVHRGVPLPSRHANDTASPGSHDMNTHGGSHAKSQHGGSSSCSDTLQAAQQLLQVKGFSHISLSQESDMQGTNLLMLNACR